MSIHHAMLGLLSWKPCTGYDLKKFFEGSTAMHWSGNNNQIYKALVQLTEEGLVSSETLHQEGAPTKKLYHITEQGRAALKRWVLGEIELPEFKKPFLVQLAWADQLSDAQLQGMLTTYEDELEMGLRMVQEQIRRATDLPARTPREKLLWEMMNDSIITSYHNELDWISRTRKALSSLNEGARP